MSTALHYCESTKKSDVIKIKCVLCDWESTATDSKFVQDLVDTHYLSMEQWPFTDYIPPKGWPEQV